MKANFLINNHMRTKTSSPFGEQIERKHREMCAKEIEYNDGPTKDVSFRGSVFSKAPKILGDAASKIAKKAPEMTGEVKIPNYARKLVNNEKFGKLINKVLEKEAVVEAAIVLGLTTTIKPLCTLIMPGASKDDKEVLATKHALSGLVGYAFSKLLYSPISKAANKVSKDPHKYLKGDTEFIKLLEADGKLHKRFDVMWKKGPDVLMSIPKSMLTVALITPTLAFLFPNHKKAQKNNPTQDKQSSDIISQKISTDKKLTFKGRQNNNNNISFTGKNAFAEFVKNTPIWKESAKMYDKFTDILAVGIGKLSIKKPIKKIPSGLMNSKKPAPLLSNLASIVLTLSLLNNTAKSKKIEKERKPYLLLNTALVTAVSSTASTIIDFCSDGFLTSMKKAYMAEKFKFNNEQIVDGLKQLKDIEEIGKVPKNAPYKTVLSDDLLKQIDRYMDGVNKLKSHTIFSFVVRFASPLLVVPLTTKILDVISKHKKKKSHNQTAQGQATSAAPVVPQAPAQQQAVDNKKA